MSLDLIVVLGILGESHTGTGRDPEIYISRGTQISKMQLVRLMP